MGSLIFYLTKCFRCILYSNLLLIITWLLLFMVHFYDKSLGLMAFVSLSVDSTNIRGSFFSKFSNKCCIIPQVRIFLFIIILNISDIISILLIISTLFLYWRYRNKPRLLERFLLSSEIK